ncbi:MAG: hypothetical protein RLY62_137 [Actinomycetota bacterium]|jgi:uncharacterized membrane protein YeaQ/YmgE (transglycosylase-associated protein family)|nr:hypothetical protein [Actinomycetota bacterium]NDG24741.1 hypothetical protein [Actinomycetota bacterium]
MKFLKSVFLGLLVGFSATLLHNIFPPFGLIGAIILTYLGVKVSEQIFIFKRYQIYTSLAWLLVVVRAGSIGFADELLIYGNTSGNVFMIGGFLAILFGFFSKTSFTR